MASANSGKSLSSLFKAAEEEEDEEDAPLMVPLAGTTSDSVLTEEDADVTSSSMIVDKEEDLGDAALISSQEFTDACTSINLDPFDCASWHLYLEEVHQGRSGSVTLDDAYAKFFAQFPRAFHFWNRLIQHYLQKNEFASCESLFAKCLTKSRNVKLWCSYIELVKRKAGIDATVKTASQLTNDRQLLEAAFEKAIENVGISPDSGVIWKDYIEFVQNWPDLSNNIDSGRKLLALRKLYQRALCIPNEYLEVFWKSYEALERSAGELLAERVLPEYNEKYLHAVAIYKDRMRYHYAIDFDRLAVRPLQTANEIQQLLAWDQLIRFERTNPDNLTPDQLRNYLLFIFDQFISCFRHHAEVWIELSKLEQQQQPPRIAEARAALREGIELIPDVVTLRIALAEFEENQNMFEVAREVYRSAFEALPSALTFSCFQRFVRRREGIAVARRLFSETLPLRSSRKLGIDVYTAHALLELEVNCKPEIALKVLDLAREFDNQACLSNVSFIRLYIRILLRLGNLEQIRWLMQTILSDEMTWTSSVLKQQATSSSLSSTSALGPGGVMVTSVIASGVADTLLSADYYSKTAVSSLSANNNNSTGNAADDSNPMGSNSNSTSGNLHNRPNISSIFSLQDQLQLWDDYLTAETTLGMSSVSRLDELRSYRDKVKNLLVDLEAARVAAANNYHGLSQLGNASLQSKSSLGIFQTSADLCERYTFGPVTVPSNDEALRNRSKGKKFLYEIVRHDKDKQIAVKEAVNASTRKRNRDSNNPSAASNLLLDLDDTASSLLAVPVLLREFLAKLPNQFSGPALEADSVIRQLRMCVLPPKPSMEESENANLTAVAKKAIDDENNEFEEERDVFSERDDIFRRRRQRSLAELM